MKVNMSVKEVAENGKRFMRLIEANEQIKEVSERANVMYNVGCPHSWFQITKNEIKTYPKKDGYIDDKVLSYLDENFESILKFAEKFEWDEKVSLYDDVAEKAAMIVWLMENWDENWSKSPYGYSFYSSKNIDWGYKPEGSIRVSDHWNFGEDCEHCPTAEPVDGWAVCRYEDGIYHLIQKFQEE